MALARTQRSWSLLALILSAGTGARADPPVRAREATCGHDPAPGVHALLAALPGEAYGPFAPTLSEVRVVMAELDGEAPTEAVLSATLPGEGHGPRDVVWVFSRRGDGWALAGRDAYEVNLESGNVDDHGRRGNVVVRGERLDGSCREVLRVERLRTNFQSPPASSRTFELFTLGASGLHRAFGCNVEGNATRYAISFERRGGTLALRVTPRGAGPTATYRFDGTNWRTSSADLCDVGAWTATSRRILVGEALRGGL